MLARRMEKCCTRGHRCPTLIQVGTAFGLKLEEILNVYIVGSHMWETCCKNSDWDLVIVLKHLSDKPQNCHRGVLEALIISKDHYESLIDAHAMQALLTLWLPEPCVLQELFDPRTHFKLSKPKLASALKNSEDRDLRIADKHFAKGDYNQAKKVLMHCIRYLDMGVQCLNNSNNCSLDYTSANRFRDCVLNNYSTKWEDLLMPVQSILDDLWSIIKNN